MGRFKQWEELTIQDNFLFQKVMQNQRICKYLIETNHVFSADMFIFNKQYFENLPADVQKVLTEAMLEAAAWRNEECIRVEADFKKKFQEQGVECTCQRYLGVIHGFFQLAGVSRAARSAMRDVAWRLGQ